MPAIDLGVGEPQHPVPAFVGGVLAANLADFRRYPPIKGSIDFRNSVRNWLDKRYGLDGFINADTAILPLNGSREGLFFALFEAQRRKPVSGPIVFSPNPFYQTYAATAEAVGCQFLAPARSRIHGADALPDFASIDPQSLSNTIAVYVASPSNPEGTCASVEYWERLIKLAHQYDFMVFADECYSEIYRDAPPIGVLEVAKSMGSLRNVISFNSLSKRSNLAGLRVGFMAGHPEFLANLTKLRNMAAPQVPLPAQAVAAAAYSDETHVVENRKLYNQKFKIAFEALSDVLPLQIPDGGFFLWIDCSTYMDGESLAHHLWKEIGLRVVPGTYLTANEIAEDGKHINRSVGKIRLALVHDVSTTEEAMSRLKKCLDQLPKGPGQTMQTLEKADR